MSFGSVDYEISASQVIFYLSCICVHIGTMSVNLQNMELQDYSSTANSHENVIRHRIKCILDTTALTLGNMKLPVNY